MRHGTELDPPGRPQHTYFATPRGARAHGRLRLDSPLPYEVVQLLLSHPQLTAGIILTLRDIRWTGVRAASTPAQCCKCCSVLAPPCGAKE